MKRVFLFTLSLVLMITLSLSCFSVTAADYGCDVATSSSVVYLENLNTGTVVYEKNSDEKIPPASLTKIMTYIVVVENVPDLINTEITITEEALADLDPESSVMGLTGYIGESFSVLELLYGLMLPSGNDAALVLADYVGDGLVENFVDMMNRKAGQLSCTGTHFVNPHGLYDSMHYSTAKDLSVITKYAFDKPYFSEITSTARYKVDSMAETLETTNYLIDPSYPQYYYEYAQGVKTGYTDEAGKCLVSVAQNGDYRYLSITLGAPYSYAEDINYAMLDSKALYTWAFDNISFVEILPAGDVIRTYNPQYVWGDAFVDGIADGAVTALLPDNYDESLVTTETELPPYIDAPVEKGEVFGTITVYYDGDLVGKTNVVAAKDIERDQTNYLAHRFVGFVVNNIIWIVIVLVLLIIFLCMYISSRKRKKRRQSRYRYR